MKTLPPKLAGLSASIVMLLSCAPKGGAETPKRPLAAPITIRVDATEASRHLLHARLTIPAQPGPMTLYYPKWIPGEHGPTGPIVNLAGLTMSAMGKPLPFRRDAADLYAFRCDVPAGAPAVEVELDFLGTQGTQGFSSSAGTTEKLVDLSWNQLLLYPAGRSTDEWTYAARLRLPSGWRFGTALPVESEAAGEITFKPVSLTTLVDSPVIAGEHYQRVPLVDAPEPVQIDMVADSAAALAMRAEEVRAYKALVAEAYALFGAHHYRGYHFLMSLSDRIGSFGLEHHESSDDRVGERTLLDDQRRTLEASLLPHEFVHSWNGKYRRPAGLATADYQQPMKGDLLWVYEGLTEYLGAVLTARSGLWSEEAFRDNLALVASNMEATRGRATRPLGDTAVAASILYQAPFQWSYLRRGVDFYPEGKLVWLEVDAILRQASGGARSIDDFCRRFHGGASAGPEVKTYVLDDIIRALGEVAPYDWSGFWAARLWSTSPHAPLGGVEASGYTLVYDEVPSAYHRAFEQVEKVIVLSSSLGLWLREDGAIGDVVPGLPAAAAGMGPGMRLVAINGRRFSAEVLHDALRAGKAVPAPLELLVENGDFFRTYRVDYHGGDRYPHLTRDPKKPDLLAAILKARRSPS